jgi:ubiquinone/menaquinone biosynthesis C-methylase UbiE
MDRTSEATSRSYYDEFAKRYDDRRGGRVRDGYHDLIDDLEVGFVRPFAAGRDLLEVGCGTGLLLERFAGMCKAAKGVDLSPGMLEKARQRGLDVLEGSATALPFDDASFDVAVSFKVLAHIPDIRTALAEMTRVVRPGGHVIAEFYNPRSVRALAKRLAGPLPVGDSMKEDVVYTRFDRPEDVPSLAPANVRVVAERGIRIVTPAAKVLELPFVGEALRRAEHLLCDGPLARLGGFYVVALRKDA